MLLCAAVASAACTRDAPILLYSSDHPSGPSCLSSRACPAPAPLAPCATSDAVVTLDAVADHDELAGKEVAVEGPLEMGEGTCTLAGCYGPDPRGACCNRCGQALALGSRNALQLFGPATMCKGDESRVCCPVDVRGQAVVAHGTLRVQGTPKTWFLEDARLCVRP